MLERSTQHKEIYDCQNRLNDAPIVRANWSNIVTRGTSPVMKRNPLMVFLITQLDTLMEGIIDSPMVARNWFNYRLPKWYNGHIK